MTTSVDNTLQVPYRISKGPWLPPKLTQNIAHGLRTFLWLPIDFRIVSSPSLGELVPVGSAIDENGDSWQALELPKNHEGSDDHSVIRCVSQRSSFSLKIPELRILPPRGLIDEVEKFDSQGEDDIASGLLYEAGFDDRVRKGSQIAKLIDRHSDLVYQLLQTANNQGPYIDSDFRGFGARTSWRISNQWDQVGRSRVPPLSLIVRLADEIPDVLEEVCKKPRVILRRQREIELATRIRQVDSACIRWMSRQPGRTLAEKAGPRQRLMGIVRREDCDTAENRVVLDLLLRCKRAGELYLARNREFVQNERVANVRQFSRLCSRLLKTSEISSVGRLVGVAQTNYVLQHESRYSVLWNAYQRLIRHEKVTQSTWMWRDRLWSEWIWFAIASGISSFSVPSPAYRDRILLSDEPTCGKFSVSCSLGPWWIRNGKDVCSIHLVPGSYLQTCPNVPSAVSQLCPDYAIVRLGQKSCGAAIWTNLDPVNPQVSAASTAAELKHAIADSVIDQGWKFWVLTGGGRSIETGESDACVSWVTVPLMPQDYAEEWRAYLREVVSHVM